MKIALLRLLLLITLCFTPLCNATGTAATLAKVIAEYPPGTFLENLVSTKDGNIVFTSYFGKELLVLDKDNDTTRLSTLPVHPVSIVQTDGGFVVAGHGIPFTAGPEFTRTQQILLLDNSGAVRQSHNLPDARFLNGMTPLHNGLILIADSIAGTVWQFDPTSGELIPWLKHSLLAQDTDNPVFLPGANGIKVKGSRVVISNSSRGALLETSINGNSRPDSSLSLLHQTGPIDDFTFDGTNIVFTTHGETLKLLDKKGTVSVILEQGCGACTAVTRRASSYVVLTTGGMLDGKNYPARVLEVSVE